MNGRAYSRPSLSGNASGQSTPTVYDGVSRAGSQAPMTGNFAASQANMTRAERFEDERRRIIESCFSKIDSTTGVLAESYIIHIRVMEDAAFPQAPPPPESPQENKKPRIIVVAVRNSGRVRMHKGRENSNGTFSIGKTWNLDDLSKIQSFTYLSTQSTEEEQWKMWAGDRGFMVTLIKPYYWQAATAKEKDFFIQSLVKIYKKYTSGRVPELSGFSTSETEALTGGSAPAQGRANPPPSSLSPPRGPRTMREMSEPSSRETSARPAPGTRSRAGSDRSIPMSRTPSQGQLIPPPVPPAVETLRQQRQQQASPDRGLRTVPSREQGLSAAGARPPSSRDQGLDRPFGAGSSVDSQRLTPQSSRSEMNQLRPGSAGTSASSKLSSLRPYDDSPPRQKSSTEEQNPPANGLGISQPKQYAANGVNRVASPFGQRPPNRPSFSSGSSLRGTESADEANFDGASGRKPGTIPKKSPAYPPRDNGEYPKAMSISEGTRRENTAQQMPGAFVSTPDGSESIEQNGLYPTPSPRRATSPNTVDRSGDAAASSDTTESAAEQSETAQPEEDHRPGLGPMIKPGLGPMIKSKGKVQTANALRKAATAYTAFKPRAGGAGEKLRLLKESAAKKQTDEPDGITGVVPAPNLLRRGTNDTIPASPISPVVPTGPRPSEDLSSSAKVSFDTKREEVPEVKVISPLSAGPSPDVAIPIEQNPSKPDAPKEIAVESEEVQKARRRKRRSDQQIKYLSALGIETTILDGRGLEFESLLGDFGWGAETSKNKKIDILETEIKKELGRVEAGSWLMSGAGERDERVDQVEKMLDRAIKECEELDTLLTLYSVELSSLNDDIAFIEAQSQGLQVQTANQKLLQAELQILVGTISITTEQLEPLRRGAIGSKNGLREIEEALVVLYKAMITIDPSIRQGNTPNGTDAAAFGSNELASMRALQEKRDNYTNESTLFLERLKQFMDMTFGAALLDTKDGMEKLRSNGQGGKKLDTRIHDLARNQLWQYSPMMLFAKEVDGYSWDGFLKMYQVRARPIFQEELRDCMAAWKKIVRKPTGDEADLLFTTQEKETDSISGTARKLTVKRSQTLARTLRNGSADKAEREKQSGKLFPFEVFSSALDEMKPILFTEQNFIVDFFHATSAESMEFVEAVAASSPNRRTGPNLEARKLFEPDRAMAKKVAEVMEDIFATWPNDVQNLVEWAVRADPLQGLGVLATLDRHLILLEETNQDFLTRTLLAIQTRLSGLFTRFVDEQVRSIEDTKVKIKKRKGVIGFIKVFPGFSACIENMLPPFDEQEHQDRHETRIMVDEAYAKINKAMFESLKVIAKEAPGVVGAGADPEDKEALNYHILLIENMNHYVEEVDDRGDPVLAEWRASAQTEGDEHLALYVDAVIRRPLGRIIDFVEQCESLASASSTARSTAMSAMTLRKLISSHDSKELRRGVEALKKRVDKHFGDADDPGISRNLVLRVLKACEAKYVGTVARVARAQQEQFAAEETGEFWRVEDVTTAFKR